MNADDDPPKKKVDKPSPENVTVTVDKTDAKKSDEEPKPRIVLTFRSEKSNAKSTNMKIVSTEEKTEEAPRRSSRTRGKWEWICDSETSPKKDKSGTQTTSENDESDSSHTTPKRSKRRRSKDCDNVLANAIARKEKSYETQAAPQRLSRRIKPTAKILANEELRIGLESQNNARLGIQSDKSPEEGVRTRRSARPAVVEEKKPEPPVVKVEVVEIADDDSQSQNTVMKLKHLCELGLKAISPEDVAANNENRDEELEGEEIEELEDDDEIDDDPNVISKLLETDEESDEDFQCSIDTRKNKSRQRRSTRLTSTPAVNDSEASSPTIENQRSTRRSSKRLSKIKRKVNYLDNNYDYTLYYNTFNDREWHPKQKRKRSSGAEEVHSDVETEEAVLPRRSSERKTRAKYLKDDGADWPNTEQNTRVTRERRSRSSDAEMEDNSNPADGEEGSEAARPVDKTAATATCFCETTSNVYAAPDELTEPVFCQAIEMVDGIRVGCSHRARRERTGECSLAAMLRAGPRAPYFLSCTLHAAQLAKHMCCPACGLFCSQGTFYQCSRGHLFHLDCGLPYNDVKGRPGCPHCGIFSYRWQPANTDCVKVKVEMKCSNKRIFLPDQREQCTPAYLSFSTTDYKVDQGPIIPEDLLPSTPIDLKALGQPTSKSPIQLCEAILKGESVEQLIPKLVSSKHINRGISSETGGTCAHAAARGGHVHALHVLRLAGAHLDVLDHAARTPLMVAVYALLEKPDEKTKAKDEPKKDSEDMEVDNEKESPAKTEKEDDKSEKADEAVVKPKEEDLIKVIRYLIAAGCDVNFPGPEGMTALHICAQLGGARAAALLLASTDTNIDARDHGGWTPLVWAAENEHTAVVQLLLEAGADVSATDNEGNGVVHWCALGGAASALRLLLAAAPSAAAALNAHADTPLHVAARQGHYACVVILLARGARTDIENSAGELPIDVCKGQCHSAISLNMQMTAIVNDNEPRYRLLSSDISNGREQFPIPCVNEVDDAGLPDDFTYVTRHVMPQPISIDDTIDNMQGCECKDGDCSSGECSCCALGVRCWYTRGRLQATFPYHDPPMLFECNQTCGCNLRRCNNSVVTKAMAAGSMCVRATVARVGGARGWGLRARGAVGRGACVALYCGELLPLPLADTRARDQYMFALDVKHDLAQQCENKTQLCVDAAQYGSAARFINHSCKPNLAPVRVFTHSRDLRLPTVALFAITDINVDDEFTFDYGDKFWSVKSKWMKCECGHAECRYPVKSTEETESS